MSYTRYIASGTYSSLRKGGGIIQTSSKIYQKKMHKCLDCLAIIGRGNRKKRCDSCADKYSTQRNRLTRARLYYKSNSFNHHKTLFEWRKEANI